MKLCYIPIMKKSNYISVTLFLFLWAVIILLLYYSASCFTVISDSINLFIYTVFPAIFPFILLTELLINFNLISYLSLGLDFIICKVFRISKCSAPAIILGTIFGYPNSIKYATMLYENGNIKKNEYTKLLCFINNPSSIYFLSSIGIVMFKSFKIGIILFVSSVISNILLGILYNPHSNSIIQQRLPMSNTFMKKNLKAFDIFLLCIKNTFYSLIYILAFMIIFNLIPDLLCNILNVSEKIRLIIVGFFDISSGANLISLSNLDIHTKLIFTSFVLNFSSIMVIMQLFNVCYKHISFKRLCAFKIAQGILSSVITYIMLKVVNISQYIPVFSSNNTISYDNIFSKLMIIYFVLFFVIAIHIIICVQKMTE